MMGDRGDRGRGDWLQGVGLQVIYSTHPFYLNLLAYTGRCPDVTMHMAGDQGHDSPTRRHCLSVVVCFFL